MTIWSPDTCGVHPSCEIELDDTPGPNQGEPLRHLRVCVNHAQAAMDHNAVAVECRTKESARSKVAQALALKNVDWSIHPTTRAISVYVPGLTPAGQATAQGAISGLAGVIVVPNKAPNNG